MVTEARDLRIAPILLLLSAIFIALLVGAFVGLFGGALGYASLFYLAAMLIAAISLFKVASTPRVIAFPVLAVVIGLPILGYTLPPRRFGLTLFDVVMIVLGVRLLWITVTSLRGQGLRVSLLPSKVWLAIYALMVPSIIFSQFRRESIVAFLLSLLVYLFFVALAHELQQSARRDILLRAFIWCTIFLGLGFLVERVSGLNLALQTFNLNQAGVTGGVLVLRMRGFFGDPQKGAQFMACAVVFLSVLLVRGRFKDSKTRLLAMLALAIGIEGLLLTASRGALAAAAVMLPISLLVFNRWFWIPKALAILLVAASLWGATEMPRGTFTSLLPATVAARLSGIEESAEFRKRIWFDTWEMYADHPLQGIGLGSFGPYMERALKTTGRYMDFGRTANVGYIPDQPESGYFKILYEGGILGSTAAALLVIFTLIRLISAVRSATVSAEQKTEAIAAFAALSVFAITFVTLFTLSDRRIAVLLVFMLAFVWAPTLVDPAAKVQRQPAPAL